MPAALELARVSGLIVLVWFALVGWKLAPLVRAPRVRAAGAGRGGK